jgi:NAD(P)-dependent dehydrogenase (short-subunit alcohol dehydrogenase family)
MAEPNMALELPTYTKTFHRKPYPAIDVTNPANSVAGKVIVVTGGGMGIGLHIALAFAKAGAKAVIITGRTESRLRTAKAEIEAANQNTETRYFVADVVDTEKVNSAFKTVKAEIGPIDVLISNAGYFPDGRTVVDGSDPANIDEFMKAFDVNVRGHLVVTSAFYKNMAPGGTLVNVSSAAAHFPYVPNHAPYSASKTATAFLMQYMDTENGDKVRIFNLHPGVIATSMTEKSKVENLDDDSKRQIFSQIKVSATCEMNITNVKNS